jgi:hypothetical protein
MRQDTFPYSLTQQFLRIDNLLYTCMGHSGSHVLSTSGGGGNIGEEANREFGSRVEYPYPGWPFLGGAATLSRISNLVCVSEGLP